MVGAQITSAELIDTRGVTPSAALINEAASLYPPVGWPCACWISAASAPWPTGRAGRDRTPRNYRLPAVRGASSPQFR